MHAESEFYTYAKGENGRTDGRTEEYCIWDFFQLLPTDRPRVCAGVILVGGDNRCYHYASVNKWPLLYIPFFLRASGRPPWSRCVLFPPTKGRPTLFRASVRPSAPPSQASKQAYAMGEPGSTVIRQYIGRQHTKSSPALPRHHLNQWCICRPAGRTASISGQAG